MRHAVTNVLINYFAIIIMIMIITIIMKKNDNEKKIMKRFSKVN